MGILNLAKLEIPKKEDEPLGDALTKGFQALAKKKNQKKQFTKDVQKDVKKSEDKSFTPDEDWSQA